MQDDHWEAFTKDTQVETNLGGPTFLYTGSGRKGGRGSKDKQ